ncbi:tyrosine-type recombinase/integrase [Methylobacterium aerolatum]|uniref:Integrase n=1 Tax=Methylobacterium aerolatum TaxID=418708 RepID=A0ABU0I0E1_9HYPH|nr:site-specific integrase [Methylobacterium aerolatum]MDQ0448068.1 integrase [Methylobacterium aerolatum]GJD36461.1 Tyrosine recombinase XerC [Methylobacterium aerolatum]
MPRRAEAENVVRLTQGMLATLTPKAGKAERIIWDEEVRGFGIRLRASGARTWVIRPPRKGKGSNLHTLAPAAPSAGAIDLRSARQKANETLSELALGGDPFKKKREATAQAAVTLGSLVETYLANKLAKGRRPSTVYGVKNHLNLHWAPLHERPLSEITRAEIAAQHRKIANECGPHAADRARSILSTFFVWAIGEGLVEGDINPVQHTNTATVPTRRDRVLRDAELAAIWHGCRDDDFGRIVRLLILTGQRRSEVAAMRWSEIDIQAALWTIPAVRMKNRRAHEVPLSGAALDILATIQKRDGRDLVFGEGKGPFAGFSNSKIALNKRIDGAAGEWGLHDLRRTVSTGMNALGIMPIVVEAVLSHVSGARSGVAGTYNRHAYSMEKRDALDRWADRITRSVAQTAAG